MFYHNIWPEWIFLFNSVAQLCLILCSPMDCSTPGLPVHHQLQELTQLMSIKSVMPSNHLIHCGPLLFPPLTFPSNRVFSNESVLRIRWPKYWNFSFNISPSNKYSGLISFRGKLRCIVGNYLKNRWLMITWLDNYEIIKRLNYRLRIKNKVSMIL